MKKTMRLLTMASLAVAGAVMAGCSGSDDIIDDAPQPATQTDNIVTMKTTVGLDGGGETRALDPLTREKTFAVGDQLAVLFTNTAGRRIGLKSHALTAEDITNNGKSATFTFEFVHPHTHCEPDTEENLQYVYPASMVQSFSEEHVVMEEIITHGVYAGQTGSLEYLGQRLDLTTYEGDWGVDGNLPSATLENQLAILAINLKNADGTESITKDLTEVVINIENGKSYVVSTDYSFGQDVIYVGIFPTGEDVDVTVTATDGTKFYTKTLTGKSYEKGHGYNVSWRMTEVDLKSIPLTIQVDREGSVVVNNPREGMQYSLNGGEKTPITKNPTTIHANAGDRLQFYGNGKSITKYWASESDYTSIGCIDGTYGSLHLKVYGNIMSLVDEEGFATNTTLPENNTFRGLFSGNFRLYDARNLLLPATTLSNYCYAQMFQDCTSLTEAPVLPAEDLTEGCYQFMFQDCESLESVTCLAFEGINIDGSTTNWLSGVASEGTFYKAARVRWPRNENGIPDDWEVEVYGEEDEE